MEIFTNHTISEFQKDYFLLIEKIYPQNLWQQKKNTSINTVFFHKGIVLKNEKEVLATAVLYLNPCVCANEAPAICFGNFECVNDREIAGKLFSSVVEEAKQAGKEILIGPMNGSTWDEYKWATNSFENYYLTDLLHPAYYPQFAMENGFTPLADYFSQIDTDLKFDEGKLQRALDFTRSAGVTFRNMDLNNYENELDKLYNFCTLSFKNNFLYSGIEKEKFKEKYRPLKQLINPDLVFMAIDEKDEFRGLMFAFDNFPDKEKKGIVLKTLARSPEKKYSGLGTILSCMLYERIRKKNYEYIIHAFMHQSNVSKNISDQFSGRPFKNYSLFQKKLNEY
ncbi:MAG: hypothetical protein IAF38_19305 [Bacteroidia bacterium]|nr:hypothetical protein [Bacteroidia bacterium]